MVLARGIIDTYNDREGKEFNDIIEFQSDKKTKKCFNIHKYN